MVNTSISKTPAFNLKVAVAETGIKPDTLRAWERRYGLPEPERTAGKHRLYSQYDLETIKWLIARQGEGMSISRAVKLWRQLESEGQNPLFDYGDTVHEQATIPIVAGTRIEELRAAWIAACHEFDEKKAEQVLAQAFAQYPSEAVALQVLSRGLSEIGMQWYTGDASVQQEHFASALAMRRLHTLVAATPPPTRRERIIVASPPHEDHAFAPLLLTLLLRHRGWEVIYLGTDVPQDRLETTLDAIKPDLVLMSAQQLHTAASLRDIGSFLQEQGVPLAFGGLIFNQSPDLPRHIPGHFLGARIEDVPQMVEKLLNFSPPVPDTPPIDESYRIALAHYRYQQSHIEAYLWEMANGLNKLDMATEHFSNANREMGQNIIASLTLGDMSLMDTELAWIEQLLANYQWPADALSMYLSAYNEATAKYLNGRGKPIVDWLEQAIKIHDGQVNS